MLERLQQEASRSQFMVRDPSSLAEENVPNGIQDQRADQQISSGLLNSEMCEPGIQLTTVPGSKPNAVAQTVTKPMWVSPN